ncbi:MAG: hypothetical protein KIT08_01265 [Anaerolineales bacterium]|nr:MAG: hypothetical protein KIT08_01265 [Anaerolineales bacterium]
MAAEFQFAESHQITRQPTEQERDARRVFLMERNQMDAWMARIEAMPDGEAKAREAVKYQMNLDAIENDVSNGMVSEWVTTYREPTPAELRQRELDLQEVEQALAAEAEERQRLLGLARTAAGNVKLSLADYLSLHPVAGLRLEDIEDER